MVRLNPANASEWRVVAGGLHNPWRMSFTPAGALYVTDTGDARGVASAEEVNGPIDVSAAQPPSFGFPCMAGTAAQPGYASLGSPLCAAPAAAAFVPPAYAYSPGTFNATAASVSALAVVQGRLYVGDYSLGAVWSVTPAGGDLRLHVPSGAVPVDLAWTGAELVYVNMAEAGVGAGSVRSLPGGPLAPSSGAASPGLLLASTLAVGAAVAGALLLRG